MQNVPNRVAEFPPLRHSAGPMTTRTTVPFDREAVRRIIEAQPFDVRKASIREMNRLVNAIEADLNVRFIRMEFGIPGLPVSDIAIRAEIEALRDRKVA